MLFLCCCWVTITAAIVGALDAASFAFDFVVYTGFVVTFLTAVVATTTDVVFGATAVVAFDVAVAVEGAAF